MMMMNLRRSHSVNNSRRKQTDKRRWTDVARLPTHNLPVKADRQYRPCTAAASSATMSRGVTKYSRSTIFGVTATAAV